MRFSIFEGLLLLPVSIVVSIGIVEVGKKVAQLNSFTLATLVFGLIGISLIYAMALIVNHIEEQ